MSEQQERIVCAAIKIAFEKCGSHYEIEICETNYDFIRQSWAYSELSFSEIKHETEGFRTNLGRFVDPKEAMGIAVKAGQTNGVYLIDGFQRGLKPEDLY